MEGMMSGYAHGKGKPFGVRDKIGYALGDFGCNMTFQLISSYLMIFASQALRITSQHWAILIIVAKLFDAINDPIVGAIVDSRQPSKHGKFRPWLLYGSFAVLLTTVLLFINVGTFPYWGRFAYVLAMYCLWSIAYTMVNVPYGSLNAALTAEPAERASLSSLRSIGAAIAALPVMVVLPMIVYSGEADSDTGIRPILPDRFVWIALVCGLIGVVGFLLTFMLTRERHNVPKAEKYHFGKTIVAFFKNRAVLGMCLASFAQIVFVMSYTSTLPLICQYYFLDPSMLSWMSLLMMVPMMVLIPFMGNMTKRWGARAISMWPNLGAIAILTAMLFVRFPQNAVGGVSFAFMLGLAVLMGGTFTLATWSMVADCVDQQEINTGQREEGSVYAVYSLSRKIAQGVGSAFVMLCMGFVGYNQGQLEHSYTARNMLRVSIVLPLVGFIIIFLSLLLVYNLTKKRVAHNVAFLRDRHEAILEVGKVRELFGESSADKSGMSAVIDADILREEIGVENAFGYETAAQRRDAETMENKGANK